jgi:hypothetical protein
MKILPEDVYGFLGNEVGIRSNSYEVLERLRLMYGRFYLGCDDTPQNGKRSGQDESRFRIQIVDNLASSNELFLNDNFYLYRLSKTDTYCRVTCKDLRTLINDSLRTCDPLTFVQGAVLRTICLLARDYQLMHAGAVSRENEGIIFPALSRMGKTTLALKLVSHGFRFLSDEVACINPDLEIVEPFPRKVNIRHGSRMLLRLPLKLNAMASTVGTEEEWEWTLDIEDIVPRSLSNPCTLRYILFLRGFGEKPGLEYISSANALFELPKFSISPIDNPAFMLFKFAPLLNKIQCFNLVMGDLDETAELVMQLTDHREE